jgi:hypothetical protein
MEKNKTTPKRAYKGHNNLTYGTYCAEELLESVLLEKPQIENGPTLFSFYWVDNGYKCRCNGVAAP